MYQFCNGVELINLCKDNSKDIAEVVILSEIEENGKSYDEVWCMMEENYQVMKNAIKDGLSPHIRSMGGLIGGNAYKLNNQTYSQNISGNITIKAASYALAVTEVNAAMGQVVAAPTGGASGVVPGVIVALQEIFNLYEEIAIKGLFVAGAIGKIIAINATLSGAEGGCQAEIGSASAMAASAAVYMRGGNPEDTLEAGALALKSTLGLVCDPVAGLVEVPCSKRNATGATIALICGDMVLAGIKSFIPFDEMVEVMYKVGQLISPCLRETAEGGCAIAASALKYKLDNGDKITR